MNTIRALRRSALRSIALLRSGNGRRTLPALVLPSLLAVATPAILLGAIAGRGVGVSNAAAEGSATIAIDAPGAAQPLLTPFTVQANLTSFSGSSTTWGGYDFELAYDPAVLKVDSVTRGLCSSSGWRLVSSTPHVVTSCALQSNRATGNLETITFECLTNDKIVLELLGRRDSGLTGLGTALFDGSAVDFPMTLTNSSATCGSGAPPLDSDGDGCPDAKELGANALAGGQRDPNDVFDFFDVPAPALLPTNMTGTRNKAISLSDVLATLAYVGTNAANPNTANANGAKYGSDLNADAIPDGQEYDRTASTTPGEPWRSGAPNGAVSVADVLVNLAQVGTNCN